VGVSVVRAKENPRGAGPGGLMEEWLLLGGSNKEMMK
jgi:hypothetical protein